jgi:TonB family protein
MRFCLDDGAVLIGPQPSVPTYISARPAAKTSGTFPLLALVALVLGGVTLLAVAGIAGVWYYAATRQPVVYRGDPSATPLDTLGEMPSPSPTQTPAPERGTGAANEVYRSEPTPSPEEQRVDPNEGKPGDNRIVRPRDVPQEPPPFNSAPTDEREIPAPIPSRPVSAGVLNGRAISKPRPNYPPAARTVGLSGTVVVQVLVDESGRVTSASAVSGHPILRAAAAQAARSARFEPMKLSGRAVKMTGVLTYNFRRE